MPGPSDEQLLRMLQEVEEQEDVLIDELEAPEDDAPQADACRYCGEPAENVGECHVCLEPGCLPPELWSPGMAEPCLTLCVRCARTIHATCAVEDEAGNPRCASCHY